MSLKEQLRRSEMFVSLPDAALNDLVGLFDRKVVPEGENLTRQGDPDTDLYFIESGQFAVIVDGTQIDEYGPGSSLGEISLIYGGERTATVTALAAGVVWSLTADAFNEFAADHASLRAVAAYQASTRYSQGHPAAPDPDRS